MNADAAAQALDYLRRPVKLQLKSLPAYIDSIRWFCKRMMHV
jgi:hypothetical protein